MRRHPRRLSLAATSLVTLVAALAPGMAGAQIFTGSAPAAATPTLSAPPAAMVPVASQPSAPDAPVSVLRHLPNTLEGLKLSGETGDLRWPVYLSAVQANAVTHFRIGHLSAVSLLTEASTLQVRVNDTVVGTASIDASHGLRVLDFAIPAGLLSAGFNAVSVAVRQRHRVDCSVAATYELWTRIDPAETGFILADGAGGVASLGDLPALLPRADGSLPIHIVMVGKTNPTHLRHLIEATQRIALAAGAQQPAVDFGATVTDAYGVNLALGTREVLSRLPPLADLLGTSGPLARLIPASPRGRPTLLVTGSSESELVQAVALVALPAMAPGAPAGLAAAASYPARSTMGTEHLTLRDLGIATQDFSGRLFRRSFNLGLPADFLSSDYARGTFTLSGDYAAGLTRDAQVRVDVNGRSAGIVKLPDTRGDALKGKQLFVPLSLLRPGLNRIDVSAETPRPADADCSATDEGRFRLSGASDLALPTLARVERLPDLAVTANGGLPYTRGKARLVVPKPDRDTMAAALSLTARLAVAAGRPVPFDFAIAPPGDDIGSTLIVASARSLDPTVLAGVGLDPARVESNWRDFAVAPPPVAAGREAQPHWWLATADGPPACRVPSQASLRASAASPEGPARAVPDVAAAFGPTAGDDLLDRWSGDKPTNRSWRDRVAAAGSGVSAWVRGAGPLRWSDGTAAPDGFAPNASIVLAQAATGAGHVTTLVTAPDAGTLRASVACLLDPQVLAKVHGRLVALDASNGGVTATDATAFRYVASGPASLTNSRLVLAGWFSLNPAAFVALALITALCLSGTTLWFVKGIGRRPE